MKWHLNKDEEGLRVSKRSTGTVSHVKWESLRKTMSGILDRLPQVNGQCLCKRQKSKGEWWPIGHRQKWEEAFWALSFITILRDMTHLFYGCFWSIKNHYFLYNMQTHELWNRIDCSHSCVHLIRLSFVSGTWFFICWGVTSCKISGIQHATLMFLYVYHSFWLECK